MISSLRSCAARSHKPLIRFVGKRQYPSITDAPHPHPAASTEIQEHFADFLKKQLGQSSNSVIHHDTHGGTIAYSNFWEAPVKLWKPRVRQLSDWEMEAVMTGGASSYSRN